MCNREEDDCDCEDCQLQRRVSDTVKRILANPKKRTAFLQSLANHETKAFKVTK